MFDYIDRLFQVLDIKYRWDTKNTVVYQSRQNGNHLNTFQTLIDRSGKIHICKGLKQKAFGP